MKCFRRFNRNNVIKVLYFRRLFFKIISFRWLFLFITITSGLIFLGYKTSRPVHYIFENEYHSMPCNLPVLDPFDPSIQQFFWKPDPVKCVDFPSIVFVDEFNVLRVNESALTFYGLNKPKDVSCTTESVYRKGDDDRIGFYIPKVVELPSTMDTDFTRVICWSDGNKVIFENIVAGISPLTINNNIEEESDEQLSVLMFGIDSVSRSASIRYLPKTLEVLRELGSYDFEGLMKNGDNTIPNIIAQQTGLKLFTNETYGFEVSTMDRWPYLWKNASARNYVTMFGEDLPWLGMFNIDSYKGFQNQPTNHYMRPFWLALGKEDKVTYHMSNVLKYFEDKGIRLTSSPLCNQNTMNHVELINYIKKFMLRYKTNRKFALTFLTELSHTFINFLHHGDDDFKDFFLWLKREGFLNTTVVVFFSDHGSRFEDIRNTFVGRMESRMPLLHILLPDHIKRKYPVVDASMKKNTRRLVSHFDIYQTIVDVLNKNYNNPTTHNVDGLKRGISLFKEVSETRSCKDAHIPSAFCACYKSDLINITNNVAVRKIADGIVNHLNKRLLTESKCKLLRLNRVLSAQRLSQGLKYLQTSHNGYSVFQFFAPEKSRESFAIIVQTVPGLATFDASCEVDQDGNIYSVKNVDRTNTYGNQTWCVSDIALKQYCYC